MDIDEFTLAMHFIFSTLNGAIRQLPSSLPPQLIPPSKSAYFPRSFPPAQPNPQPVPFTPKVNAMLSRHNPTAPQFFPDLRLAHQLE